MKPNYVKILVQVDLKPKLNKNKAASTVFQISNLYFMNRYTPEELVTLSSAVVIDEDVEGVVGVTLVAVVGMLIFVFSWLISIGDIDRANKLQPQNICWLESVTMHLKLEE